MARIENNIFFGAASSLYLVLENCPSDRALEHFRNNVMLQRARMAYWSVAAPCPVGTSAYEGVAAIQGELASHLVIAQDNVLLREACNEPACIPVAGCDNEQVCAASIFDGWTQSDGGLGAFLGGGWRLSTLAPCPIAESSLVLDDVTIDLFGLTRNGPPSMGAHELEKDCP
jgi:hypothetical protein